MTKVQWPGRAYNPAGDDLSSPMTELLIGLNLLEKSEELDNNKVIRKSLRTPASLQAITSSGTALAKWWAVFIGGIGGLGSMTAFFQGLGFGSTNPLQSGIFVASAALLLGAAVLAVAIMVKADLLSRATSTASQYEARARVTSALMNAFQGRNPLPTPVKYRLRKKNTGDVLDPTWYPVLRFERNPDSGEFTVVILTGDGTEQSIAPNLIQEWLPE